MIRYGKYSRWHPFSPTREREWYEIELKFKILSIGFNLIIKTDPKDKKLLEIK